MRPEKRVEYFSVHPGERPQFALRKPFPVLLWCCLETIDEHEKKAFVTHLLAAGCRYIVAGGRDCEAWHTQADLAFLSLFPSEREQEANFVMTTAHSGESEFEVMLFFLEATNFDEHAFSDFVVITIGTDHAAMKSLVDAERAVRAGAA